MVDLNQIFFAQLAFEHFLPRGRASKGVRMLFDQRGSFLCMLCST